jgi:hypothetical protein
MKYWAGLHVRGIDIQSVAFPGGDSAVAGGVVYVTTASVR